jgi:hypothetical protein
MHYRQPAASRASISVHDSSRLATRVKRPARLHPCSHYSGKQVSLLGLFGSGGGVGRKVLRHHLAQYDLLV